MASIWTCIVLYLCLKQFDNTPEVFKIFKHTDKVVHIFFHFILSTAWFLFFKMHFLMKPKKPFLFSFLFSFVFGILIECLQHYCTKNRTGDLYDIVANMFGSSLGLLFCLFINHRFFKSNTIQ